MEQRAERLSLLRLSRVVTEQGESQAMEQRAERLSLLRLSRVVTEQGESQANAREQRRQYVEEQWKCLNHCPSCGKCRILRGKDPEDLYADFIDGKRSYMDITLEIR